jgi:predicted O-methyltransferase YrrM
MVAATRKTDYAKQILAEEGMFSLLRTVLRRVYLALPLLPDFFTWLGRRASFGFGAEKFLLLSPVNMDQSTLRRREKMKSLATTYFKNPMNMLEIGTWFGVGSTKVWFENLPAGSAITLLDSWRPYIATSEAGLGGKGLAAMDKVHHAAIVSSLKQVYRAEQDSRLNHHVTLIRGRSSEVLRNIKAGSFNLIYVDGSHYYKDVKADLMAAKQLLNPEFSILCGDDLEVLPEPSLVEHARAHAGSDFVMNPRGVAYHPGVLLAVSEELPEVNLDNGFWWIYFKNGKFARELAE